MTVYFISSLHTPCLLLYTQKQLIQASSILSLSFKMSFPFVYQQHFVSTKQTDPLERWTNQILVVQSDHSKHSNCMPSPLANYAFRGFLTAAPARHFKCIRATTRNQQTDTFEGSENNQRNIWTHDFVDSLHGDYKVNTYSTQVEKLKEKVEDALNDESVCTLTKMVFIDDLQRLGLGYLFEKEIERVLNTLCISSIEDTLHSKALYFRLLRQNGHKVSQDVVKGFKDVEGNFRLDLCEDVHGMLNLYEASQLGMEGENILHEAKEFTIKHLEVLKDVSNPILAEEISQTLELPLHLRMPRLDSRDYIDAYQKKENMNPFVLELAKLDFNELQATHQKELKHLSRWWKHLGLPDKLEFTRDRLIESFMWSLGLAHKPQYGRCREWVTKAVCLIITIDDIYDIYGSMEELELFTSAVERWDVNAMEQLPEYMQLCFLALFNTINDIVYIQQKEQGFCSLPYLRKVWTNFCKAMLLEAKWSKMRYTPTLSEYLENAWISSSTHVVLVHAIFGSEQSMTKDVLTCLDNKSDLVYYSSMVCRLCNDLATSSAELERSDVASAIQCYMHEANISEQVARDKIKGLLSELWKKLNKTIYDSTFQQWFVDLAINHGRTSHSIYQCEDGMTVQDHEAKKRVARLLIKPIAFH